MTDRVRMAFVGIGWWSNMLAAAAQKCSVVEIAGCHSRSGEKMAAFVKEFGGEAKESWEALLGDPSIDAVVLTTPNTLHAPQAIAAAGAGKHVFVEKPMALNLAGCREMIAAAESAGRAGVVLAVGHNHRRQARYRLAKKMIDEGALGEVILAEGSHSTDSGLRIPPGAWRRRREESPGGPFTSTTIHHADNFLNLVGPIRRVTAFSSKVRAQKGKTTERMALEADDVVSAAVEFESGALGYLGGSFITQSRNFLQIHGTEGALILSAEDGSAHFQKIDSAGMVRQPLPDEATQRLASLAEQMADFARCAREGGRPEVSGEEGAAAVAVFEAIVRSAESGAPMDVEKL